MIKEGTDLSQFNQYKCKLESKCNKIFTRWEKTFVVEKRRK